MIYALDTNIISYFIQDNKRVVDYIRAKLAEGNSIVISPISYFEIRRGFKYKEAPKKEKAFAQMCELFPVGEMSLAVWERAAEIYGTNRKQGKPIEDTDILIAAFCIVNGYTFVTNNVKHFTNIDDLLLENWME